MHPLRFLWLRRPGHALAAVAAPGQAAPPPLASEAIEGASLLWLPLPASRDTLAALDALAGQAWLLFPSSPARVPQVVDAWLWLYEQAPQGLDEAVLQVVDDPAHLRDYLQAEQALWDAVYAAHPHREDDGILPGALDEARWLVDAVLDAPGYEEHSEFLVMSAFETIARELLVTVRKAELRHLQQHLQGIDTVSGW